MSRRTDSDGAAEDDEAADAELERVGDARRPRGRSRRRAAARSAGRISRAVGAPPVAHAGVTVPSTRAPRGAGRGRDVAGLAVQREVAEQREGDRFLGVAGEEQIVEPPERMRRRQRLEAAGQRGHEPGVMAAAAGGHDLRARRSPAAHRVGDLRAVSSTAVATPSAPGTRACSAAGVRRRRSARGRCSWAAARRRTDRASSSASTASSSRPRAARSAVAIVASVAGPPGGPRRRSPPRPGRCRRRARPPPARGAARR